MVRAALAVVLLLSTAAHATEGGGTTRLPGLETILSGVMVPGTRFSMYLSYYDADRIDGGDGHPRPGISGFDLAAGGTSIRLQHVWSGTQLWSASVETRVGFAVYVASSIDFDVQTPAGRLHRDDSRGGIGDLILAPVLLGWRSERYHQIAGVQFFVPTGKFDADRLANPGRGYFTASPSYWFTWFPADGAELSGTLAYLYNAENPDSDFKSGQELAFDWGAGYQLTPSWQVGASGYVYKQVTDDKVAGRVVGDGNRGQALAAGPSVRYRGGPNWGAVLKWQHEWAVENRARGDRFFLQFSMLLQ